jgi:RTX calcium-binding nonapeptide repeat (4 copies)/Domain of unknown function DUF11
MLRAAMALGSIVVATIIPADVASAADNSDLSVELQHSPAEIGELTALAVTISNAGPDAALDVVLEVSLPTGYAPHGLAAGDDPCVVPGACTVDQIEPGGHVTVVFAGAATVEAGSFSVRVSSSTLDGNLADNEASIAVSFVGGSCTTLGGAFDDALPSTPSADVVCALTGDDVITASTGADRYAGGDGSGDRVSYANATSGINLTLMTGTAIGIGSHTLTGVEDVTGSVHPDLLRGDDGANWIEGDAGDDRIYGRAGDDFLTGGAGNDFVYPGAGDDFIGLNDPGDVLSYETFASPIAVDLAEGWAFGEGTDTLSEVDNVWGTSAADTIEGSFAANSVRGRGGNDAIGLVDGYANDSVDGGSGSDICHVDAGDTAIGCETLIVVPLPRRIQVRLSAAETTRVDELVRFYSVQNETELLRFGVQVLAFINAIDPQPGPTPVVVPPPAQVGATMTVVWEATDFEMLDVVKARWALGDEGAHRWGFLVLSFIAALQGA